MKALSTFKLARHIHQQNGDIIVSNWEYYRHITNETMTDDIRSWLAYLSALFMLATKVTPDGYWERAKERRNREWDSAEMRGKRYTDVDAPDFPF